MKRIFSMLLVVLSLILMGCHNKNIDAVTTEPLSFGNEIDENTGNNNDLNSYQKYPSPMPTEPYGLAALSDSDSVNGVVGNWRWENGVLTATNKDVGNCFALTELYTVAGVGFVFEADLEITSGQAAGLVFGVAEKTNPAAHWYCVNVDLSAKNVRLFSAGVTPAVTNPQRKLTDEEMSAGKYRIKIQVDEKCNISFYLNNRLVSIYKEQGYSGGYLAFNSYKSDCRISNIAYKIGDMYSPAYNMALNVGGNVQGIDPNSSVVDLDLGKVSEEMQLSFDLLEGYTACIDGKSFKGGRVEYKATLPWGYSVLEVVFSDGAAKKSSITFILYRSVSEDVVYSDTYRPQYHFSPQMNYMNDPNGLVYNATTGEYHLFYQYSPKLFSIGNQVWGHAVSKDLVNWKEIGIAVDREADGGKIYSGSAVIDYKNTSGLFNENIPPASRMVIFYTVPDSIETQNMAYSLDDGYTWIKYDKNPVLIDNTKLCRDPKVRWMEDASMPNGGVWLMVVSGQKTTSKAQIYTSENLVDWEFNSDICDINGEPIQSECPDLFRLKLDGQDENIKWVYSGAGRFYIVGDLVKDANGKYQFTATQERKTDYVYSNGRYYATQSYFNIPNGDTVTFGWSNDGCNIDGKYWIGCQTLPYKVGLVTMSDGSMRLTHIPIEAVDGQRADKLLSFGATTLREGVELPKVSHKSYSIDTVFRLDKGTSVNLKLFSHQNEGVYLLFARDLNGKVTLTVDTSAIAKPNGKQWRIPIETDEAGTIKLKLYADASILEFFINDGKYAFCDRLFPSDNADKITFAVESGKVSLEYFIIYDMKSIWD